MSGCTLDREVEGGRTVIRVSGSFDRASAFELRDQLERAPTDDVVLDFSQVRDFADLGVATLAHGLSHVDRRRLSLRGLRTHQLRIFRYFGVELERADATAAAR